MTATLSQFGVLYIVATPIGNRDDISIRALKTLQAVDAIIAEDTRHSGQLLASYQIKKPLISLHAHNENRKTEEIITALLTGKSFALISDAGTPLISDPGFPLVKSAWVHGISVVPVPGACALIAALSAAGVPCDTFTFIGFLPAQKNARQQKLQHLLSSEHTLIFYESTHRIFETLDDIASIFGNTCNLVLAKELTKTFENFVSGNCADLKSWLLVDSARSKGEFVLIIPPRETVQQIDHDTHLLSVLLSELPLKQAVTIACQLSERNKNALYQIALSLRHSEN